MTGNNHCDWILMVGHAYSPGRAWLSNRFGNVTVGACFPVWNLKQCSPDRHLERGSVEIEGEIERRSSTLKIFRKLVGKHTIRVFIDDSVGRNRHSKVHRR